METVVAKFEGVKFIVPLIGGVPMEFVHAGFDDYPSRCGAGDGIGDKIVPEKIWGLCASVVCDIHDNMWDVSDPSWEDFRLSNGAFVTNIFTLNRERSDNFVIGHLRNYRAVTYFNAVDTIGALLFWKLKRDQGHAVSEQVFVDIINALMNAFRHRFLLRNLLSRVVSSRLPEFLHLVTAL